MVDLRRYYENEYEVDVEGKKYRLRPQKVWVLKPQGRPGVVIGIFRTPDGRIVRKNLGKVQP